MRVTQESLKILEPALSITEKLSKQIIPKKESSKPGTFQKQIPDYVIAQLQVIKGLFSLENETQTLLFTKAFLGKYFKRLPSQPTLNRRSKQLAPYIEEMRRQLLISLGVHKKKH